MSNILMHLGNFHNCLLAQAALEDSSAQMLLAILGTIFLPGTFISIMPGLPSIPKSWLTFYLTRPVLKVHVSLVYASRSTCGFPPFLILLGCDCPTDSSDWQCCHILFELVPEAFHTRRERVRSACRGDEDAANCSKTFFYGIEAAKRSTPSAVGTLGAWESRHGFGRKGVGWSGVVDSIMSRN
jgi:hypothetical protein